MFELGELLVRLLERSRIPRLGAELIQRADVVDLAQHLLDRLGRRLDQLHLRHDALGGLLVVPEAVGVHLVFEFFSSRELARQVKESRGWQSSAPQGIRWIGRGSRGSCRGIVGNAIERTMRPGRRGGSTDCGYHSLAWNITLPANPVEASNSTQRSGQRIAESSSVPYQPEVRRR